MKDKSLTTASLTIRGESGQWEVATIFLMHDYKKHPLITIARKYETVTGQKAFDDALQDLNDVIAAATKERDAMLSKKPVIVTNIRNGKSEEIKKV